MPSFIGFWELMALAAVLLLLFGPKRLPEIGRSLGKGMREFKESVTSPLEPSYDADDAPRNDPRHEVAPGAPRHLETSAAQAVDTDSPTSDAPAA